jgi:hypothetical protein
MLVCLVSSHMLRGTVPRVYGTVSVIAGEHEGLYSHS